MATLVTGGTGFIGANIVSDLALRGHQVISLDVMPVNDMVRGYLEPWRESVTWMEGDILDKRDLERLADAAQIDKIIHAAAHTPYLGDLERADARRTVDINLFGTVNLLDLARRVGATRFLFCSSIAVYGGDIPALLPLREDIPLKPTGIYHITKVASELLTARYGELYGFDGVSVRYATNFGPMERVTPFRHAMSMPFEWVGKALRGEYIEPLPMGRGQTAGHGFGEDFPYVKDTASAIGALIDAPHLKYTEYNISTGHRVYLHEMIAAMREVYPKVKFVEPIPREDSSIGLGYTLDVTRMQSDVGFMYQYDLISGLRDYIKWRQEVNFLD